MFHKKHSASITVEASLLLPIFLFGLLFFIHFIKFVGVQEEISRGISTVSRELGRYAYAAEMLSDEEGVYDTAVGILGLATLDRMVKAELEENLIQNSMVVGGIDGIHFLFSSILEKDSYIDAVATYRIKIPFPFFSKRSIPMVQKVRIRAFTGIRYDDQGNKEDGDAVEESVYITETGTVYHTSKNCSHLALSIREIDAAKISGIRNESGGKYHSCEYCGGGKIDQSMVYYITSFGDRYHKKLDCSGLKRTVITIPRSEAGSRSLCKRCEASAASQD